MEKESHAKGITSSRSHSIRYDQSHNLYHIVGALGSTAFQRAKLPVSEIRLTLGSAAPLKVELS